MKFELTGRITNVLPTQSGKTKNGGDWLKNAFVVEWQENGYPQKLCLEVVGADKWDKMKSNVVVGNTVLCRFSVSSREWQGKFYTTAACFYCASVGGQQQIQTQQTTQAPQTQGMQQGNDDSGLPF